MNDRSIKTPYCRRSISSEPDRLRYRDKRRGCRGICSGVQQQLRKRPAPMWLRFLLLFRRLAVEEGREPRSLNEIRIMQWYELATRVCGNPLQATNALDRCCVIHA